MAKPGGIISGAVAIAVCVLAAYQMWQVALLRGKVQTLQRQQVPLVEQIQQLQRERDTANRQVSALLDEKARMNTNLSELLKLRGEVGALRDENQRLRQNASPEIQSAAEEIITRQNFSVRYDPALWNINQSNPRSMTWSLRSDPPGKVEVTVASDTEQLSREQFKEQRSLAVRFMGDPPELIGERVQTINGREWMVLDYRNTRRRPTSSESLYFLPTSEGYITTYVFGEEASMPGHRETVEAFLQQIRVK